MPFIVYTSVSKPYNKLNALKEEIETVYFFSRESSEQRRHIAEAYRGGGEGVGGGRGSSLLKLLTKIKKYD